MSGVSLRKDTRYGTNNPVSGVSLRTDTRHGEIFSVLHDYTFRAIPARKCHFEKRDAQRTNSICPPRHSEIEFARGIAQNSACAEFSLAQNMSLGK